MNLKLRGESGRRTGIDGKTMSQTKLMSTAATLQMELAGGGVVTGETTINDRCLKIKIVVWIR